MFNATHGLFADTWSAWLELFMSLTLTLIGGYLWGITGILLSKVITTSTIAMFWKPYYLFHSGFHRGYTSYWNGAGRNYAVSLASFGLAHFVISFMRYGSSEGFLQWICYSATGTIAYLVINILLILLFCKGAKDFMLRLATILHLNKKKNIDE